MKRSRFSETQIVKILKEAESARSCEGTVKIVSQIPFCRSVAFNYPATESISISPASVKYFILMYRFVPHWVPAT